MTGVDAPAAEVGSFASGDVPRGVGEHVDLVVVLSYAAQHIAKRERIRMTGWTIDPGLKKPSGAGP